VNELGLEVAALNGTRSLESEPDTPAPEGPIDPLAILVARYFYTRSITIYGGTSEIQRNILARAHLGL
jgi:alkylation response protein AidB-like acyl-CoA dehydrogenase